MCETHCGMHTEGVRPTVCHEVICTERTSEMCGSSRCKVLNVISLRHISDVPHWVVHRYHTVPSKLRRERHNVFRTTASLPTCDSLTETKPLFANSMLINLISTCCRTIEVFYWIIILFYQSSRRTRRPRRTRPNDTDDTNLVSKFK